MHTARLCAQSQAEWLSATTGGKSKYQNLIKFYTIGGIYASLRYTNLEINTSSLNCEKHIDFVSLVYKI